MAKPDMQDDYEANEPKDVSRLQDVLVTFIIALIGTAVSLGLYLQSGFGMIPSLCVGSGLFIWLLSAHFLITRMRLKRLVQGRLTQLTTDVKKLKNELQVTELLAEGHNELLSGQDAIENAIRTIVGRMDDYDSRLKVLQKIGKISLEKPKREELIEQNSKLELLGREFQALSSQLQNFELRYDQASQQQYNLMKAELDILEFIVQQLSVSGGDKSVFAQKALAAITNLRQVPDLRELAQSDLSQSALLSQSLQTSPGIASSPQMQIPQEQMESKALLSSETQSHSSVSEDVLPLSALPPMSKTPGTSGVRESMLKSSVKSSLPPSSLDALAVGAELEKKTALMGANTSLPPQVPATLNNDVAVQSTVQSTLQSAGQSSLLNQQSDHSLLATVNEAIEANRIELFLQPIVGLPDRELIYYEAFSRLRNDIGQLILPRDFIGVAEAAELTPIIDNQIILRSIQVIQRLVEKGKGRTVFCNLSLTSLRDADFFSEFMDFMEANKWLKDYLVFEFSQKALEKAGSQEFERMTAISNLGFKFSLDQITRLDIDFKALADRKFAFVKINASLLLGNMEGAKAQIHSADLDHFLSRLNITMIVDKVERDSIVRQLRDYNVNFAQGDLFCEPKPVRPEVYGGAGSVVAA
ncbi:MAG: EAL domain-containing protein [Rhizobiales bacterium]|nr:EAL domain-containing protein [Hyphomicrobiales bacterium]